jgi:hypothetical protein
VSLRSEEHMDDVDAMFQQDVLIPPWSPHRRTNRQPELPSVNAPHPRPSTAFAIQSNQNTFTNNGQDVHPASSDVSRPSLSASPRFNNGHPLSHPESQPLPSSSTRHGPINTHNNRLRTTIFGTTSELAAHYGIPRKLPPTPRVSSLNFKLQALQVFAPRLPHFRSSYRITAAVLIYT